MTLDEALAIYAQPKQRGRGRERPLRELGVDPVSRSRSCSRRAASARTSPTASINATLRKDDDPATITPERAAELLADKRAKGPAPKKRAAPRKTAAKKTTAKKAAARRRPRRRRRAAKTRAAGRSRSAQRAVAPTGPCVARRADDPDAR